MIEVKIPDIGDFKEVDVIEVLVKPGDRVEKESSLITVESDKATMEIPSPLAGVVRELRVKVGDKVAEGSALLLLDADASGTAASSAEVANPAPAAKVAAMPEAPATPAPATAGPDDVNTQVVVIGSGPGGYTAAFRAADLGKQVVLIERYPDLGGVCTNVGCIPSKALLHVAKVITEAKELEEGGVVFGKPAVNLGKLREWKNDVVGKGTKGIAGLARQRKVTVMEGRAEFDSPHSIMVQSGGVKKRIVFEHCIIAAGSSVARLPGFPYDDPRLMDSTGALALSEVPRRLLVIGGGIIGLEMACLYDALGSKVTVVELMDQLIPGADADLVRVLHQRIEKRYESILLKTKVTRLAAQTKGLLATFEGPVATAPQLYDRVLMAVGRRPNGRELAADKAGVQVDERGYVPVNGQCRTNVAHIYAIGDVCGEPMLAHKATHEAKVAAESIAGHKVAFEAMTIPSVAYTDPEVAWMGLTEVEAKKQGVSFAKASFPWAASGRARSIGRADGSTKLLYDPQSGRILGAGIVGTNAGELIAEMVLALEMGADMEDISHTIHPHPTLSETPCFAAEVALGSITDLYMPRKSA